MLKNRFLVLKHNLKGLNSFDNVKKTTFRCQRKFELHVFDEDLHFSTKKKYMTTFPVFKSEVNKTLKFFFPFKANEDGKKSAVCHCGKCNRCIVFLKEKRENNVLFPLEHG